MTNSFNCLIPRPSEISPGKGSFAWTESVRIHLEPDNERDAVAAQTLLDACSERSLPAPHIAREAASAQRNILIGDPARFGLLWEAMRDEGLDIPDSLTNEGYLLHVSPRQILVAGIDAPGIYYGVQTLIQMLPGRADAGIPAVRIVDSSTLPQRGISMDLFSGEVPTMQAMQNCIRWMAHYKLNLLVLYLEDAFQFPSHPDIGEGRDRLTADESASLASYAARHHVQIVPCYDSPGHMGNTLRHPNYVHLREGEENQAQRDVINVTHPQTYPLLSDLYGDLLDAFPAETHYMAGDEAFAIGTGRSKYLADRLGSSMLYLRHIKRIRDIFQSRGRGMVVSGDPFEPDFFKPFGLKNYGLEGLKHVPRDVVIGPWHYGVVDSFPFGEQLREMGFDMHLWSSVGAYDNIYPALNSAAANVESFIPYAHRLDALATIHSDWNTPGENTFFELNWPSIIFYAEWAWNSPGRPWGGALPVALESMYGPGTGELAAAVLLLADTSGYIPWGWEGMRSPGLNLLYRDIGPHRMGRHLMGQGEMDENEALGHMERYRSDLEGAAEMVEHARQNATRNLGHLDYLDYAIQQQRLLADVLDLRHALATGGNAAERSVMVEQSTMALRMEMKRLWMQRNRPLGLAPNLEHLDHLAQQARAVHLEF